MEKIICDNCGGTIGYIIGDSMIEIVRQGHKITVVGKDYSVIASCPNTGKCNNKVTIMAENGKILLENLKRKDENADSTTNKGDGDGKENESEGDDKDSRKEKDGSTDKKEREFKKGKGGESSKEDDESKDGDKGSDSDKGDKGDKGTNKEKDDGDKGEGEDKESPGTPKSRRFTRV